MYNLLISFMAEMPTTYRRKMRIRIQPSIIVIKMLLRTYALNKEVIKYGSTIKIATANITENATTKAESTFSALPPVILFKKMIAR